MLHIDSNQLKAALSHAGNKDVRYYLNGVLLEITTDGSVAIVGTDGMRCFVGRIPADKVRWTDLALPGPFEIIIPRDVVKLTCAKNAHLTLTVYGDGKYQLGNTIFTPVEGKFPDWRRIVPRGYVGGAEGSPIFNWQQVAEAQDALSLWSGRKNVLCHLAQRGESDSAVISASDPDAFCVLMPMRKKPEHIFAPAFDMPR